jgi:YegS/Rv2252/BmrU family lipid kinase
VLVPAQFFAQALYLLFGGLGHEPLKCVEGGDDIATYQNTVLIYNPVAGKVRRSQGKIITRAVEALERQGIRVRAIPTHGPGAATEIAREAVSKDIDLVLVAGGDGTINEVVNGMAMSHVPLGILPAGTANVLSIELGFGARIERAARMINECVPERISIGRVETDLGPRYFVSMIGVGLDAQIVYDVNAWLKAALGKIAYWVGGVSKFLSFMPEFDVQMGQERIRCGFALASRVRNYGGDLTIACNASILEHDFEVVLFQGRNPLRYALYFLGVLTRTLPSFRGVRIDHARKLVIPDAPDHRIYVQVDGEHAGHLPAKIEIVEDALTVLMPADTRTRLGVKVAEALLPAAG